MAVEEKEHDAPDFSPQRCRVLLIWLPLKAVFDSRLMLKKTNASHQKRYMQISIPDAGLFVYPPFSNSTMEEKNKSTSYAQMHTFCYVGLEKPRTVGETV